MERLEATFKAPVCEAYAMTGVTLLIGSDDVIISLFGIL
jgi:hypothetical protein